MQHTKIEVGSYGVNDTFRGGASHALSQTVNNNGLEKSEKNYYKQLEKQELSTARTMQGLHMSMKLQMERKIVSRIQRLPGLQSSRIALRTLMDYGDVIGPEDIFNDISENMVDYRSLGDRMMGF